MSIGPLLRLLPLAALGLALAGTSADAETATVEAASIDAPFLWQIDGGERPSYLFGTIHAGVDATELPPVVDAALHSSDLFVMETAPGERFLTDESPVGLPMDMALARNAHQEGTRVATLESLQFQLSLLEQLGSAQEFAAMLAEDPDAVAPLMDAYRSGDLDQIDEVTRMEDPAIRDILLTQRNYRWVHKLRRTLVRGGAFIAVGVGHCPGPDGLLDLLDSHGFSIRRLA
jgi:uncharacterized protein YbaP (TraB family)